LAESFGGHGVRVVPVCPEQLGGLPTPRAANNIVAGPDVNGAGEATGAGVLAGRARVVDTDGIDRTGNFVRGAEDVVRLARWLGAERAILKSRSPSCDAGFGVTAARLRAEGLAIEDAGRQA